MIQNEGSNNTCAQRNGFRPAWLLTTAPCASARPRAKGSAAFPVIGKPWRGQMAEAGVSRPLARHVTIRTVIEGARCGSWRTCKELCPAGEAVEGGTDEDQEGAKAGEGDAMRGSDEGEPEEARLVMPAHDPGAPAKAD